MTSLRAGLAPLLATSGMLLALGVCARVHAADLRYAAPSGCGSERALRSQVEQLVGEPLEAVEGMSFEVVLVPAAAGGVDVRVHTSRPGADERVRALASASCEEAVAAAAIAVAMAIGGAEPEADGGSAEVAVDEPVVEPTPEPEPSSSQASLPLRASVGAGLVLDAGALPSLAPGVALELGLGIDALHVLVQGALFGSQQARLPGSTRGGEFSFMLAALLACWERAVGELALLGCGGFELGRVEASGIDLARSEQSVQGWSALLLQVGGAWPARAESGELGVFARVGASVPLVRDEFVIDGKDRLHKPGSLTGRLLAGVQLSF